MQRAWWRASTVHRLSLGRCVCDDRLVGETVRRAPGHDGTCQPGAAPLVHALRIFLSALYGMYTSSHGPHCAASSVCPNFMPAAHSPPREERRARPLPSGWPCRREGACRSARGGERSAATARQAGCRWSAHGRAAPCRVGGVLLLCVRRIPVRIAKGRISVAGDRRPTRPRLTSRCPQPPCGVA